MSRQPDEVLGAVNSLSEMQMDALRRPITVAEYYRMAELGILAPDERVELVDGQLIVVPPMGRRHWALTTRVQRVLAHALAERATVVAQMPVVLGGTSEPVPDVSVLRYDARDYEAGKPTVADIVLLVEIAESSISIDRTKKLELYRRSRVPAYWIVNARDASLEAFRDPVERGYRSQAVYRHEQVIDIPGFSDIVLTVDELLG